MISGETARARVTDMVGAPFPLLLGRGTGHVVAVDAAGFDLLVAGLRVRVAWERLDAVVRRLSANHTLSIDEMGGGDDAVGIVSLLARVFPEDLAVTAQAGLVVVRRHDGPPVHQYADMGGLVHRWPRHRRARTS